MNKTKVCILTNIISPYRIPLFNAVSEEKNFKFCVIALTEREKNRKWKSQKSSIKFDYQILKSKQLSVNSKKTNIFFI